jgi:hypothetical protein
MPMSSAGELGIVATAAVVDDSAPEFTAVLEQDAKELILLMGGGAGVCPSASIVRAVCSTGPGLAKSELIAAMGQFPGALGALHVMT